MTDILRTEGVTKMFGALVAVNRVDLHVEEGEILGLIGPNGAGKTTLFNVITGSYPPSGGEVYFQGERITNFSQPDRVSMGMCRTFQQMRLFGWMSCLDNVRVGMHTRSTGSVWDALLPLPRAKSEERRIEEQALYYLDLLGLADYRDKRPGSLSYGDRRRLEVARALAAEPRLLLLDEPAAGMNVAEAGILTEFIGQIRDELGKTILLIEHNMRVVMPIAQRVVVLNYGEKIFEGSPDEVQRSTEVIEAYLGRAYLEQMERAGVYA